MMIMMKNEFEALLGHSIVNADYDIVEKVYMYYPTVIGADGKDMYAEMYKYFGIRVFEDMLMRSEKAEELEKVIHDAQIKLKKL
jgi:hypothetical protein